MTTITIAVDDAKKRLKVTGDRVAAGEPVSVVIQGFSQRVAGKLRLRVLLAGHTIAAFPAVEGDSWSALGSDAVGVISLNTVQARQWCRGPEVECLFVLENWSDDATYRRLWGVCGHPVVGWPSINSETAPFDLCGLESVWEAWANQFENMSISAAPCEGGMTVTVRDKHGNETSTKLESAKPAHIAKMKDSGNKWHDVSLVKNGVGGGQWVMAVDQDESGGDGSFDAEVVADGSVAARSLRYRFAERANVRDFGALGDGATDDSAAIQAALDTGRPVYVPAGVYKITQELLVRTRGQEIFGDGKGYSYGNPGSTLPVSQIFVAEPSSAWSPNHRRVRTRVKHIADASAAAAEGGQDSPLSVAIDIEAEGVSLSNLGVRLNQQPGARYGADWDIGIFVGCRREVKLDRVSVVGAFKVASIYADVTGLFPQDSNGEYLRQAIDEPPYDDGSCRRPHPLAPNGVPLYEGPSSTSIDGFSLQNSYLSGAKWGLVIRGADWADGHSSKAETNDPAYYDVVAGKAMKDLRGEAGASDVLIFNNTIFAQDGNRKRMADPVTRTDTINGVSTAHVDWSLGDSDDSGGCLLIDGTTTGPNVLNGHMILRNRFMTHIAPFNVKLVKSSSDVFIGNQFDGQSPGSEFFTSGGDSSTISNINTYGKIYTSRTGTYDSEFLCTLWKADGELGGFYYNGELVTNRTLRRGDLLWHHGWQGKDPAFSVGAAKVKFGYDEGDPFASGETVEVTVKSTGSVDANLVLDVPNGQSGNVVSKSAMGVYSKVNMTIGCDQYEGTSVGRKGVLYLYSNTGSESFNRFQIKSHVIPLTDNTFQLGSNDKRWKVLYAATGAINTSDARLKESISGIPDEVLDAWGRVWWSQFMFRDAVREKGDAARIHSGVVAQVIRDVFAAAGLDATRYGLLCHDEWDAKPAVYDEWDEVVERAHLDEYGNPVPERTIHHKELVAPARKAGDIWSVRYEEALAMEAAYQRRRADRLEARLDAIERRLA